MTNKWGYNDKLFETILHQNVGETKQKIDMISFASWKQHNPNSFASQLQNNNFTTDHQLHTYIQHRSAAGECTSLLGLEPMVMYIQHRSAAGECTSVLGLEPMVPAGLLKLVVD
jgi:hypothetical protein